MKLTAITSAMLLLVWTVDGPPVATARRIYVNRIPNGANVPGVEALGHTDNTGDDAARNAFGRAFQSAGRSWSKELCQADTDGDGQTNGQELGDPCCTWSQGSTPTFTTGLSHPSDASSMADPARWANVQCSSEASPSPTPSSSNATDSATNSSTTSSPSTTPSTASTGTASRATTPTTRSHLTLAIRLAAGVVAGTVVIGLV